MMRREVKELNNLKKAFWTVESKKIELEELRQDIDSVDNKLAISELKRNIKTIKNNIDTFLSDNNLPPFYMIDDSFNIGYLEESELKEVKIVIVTFEYISVLFITDDQALDDIEPIFEQVAKKWGEPYTGQEITEDLEMIFDNYVLYHGGNLAIIELIELED